MASGIYIRPVYTNILISEKKCIRLEHRATMKNMNLYKTVFSWHSHVGNVERIRVLFSLCPSRVIICQNIITSY
jgi:hypothetical protein